MRNKTHLCGFVSKLSDPCETDLKKVRDGLVLQLSLMFIILVTHHLTTSPPLWGFWGADTESVLGLLVTLNVPPSLPRCLSADRW